MSTGSDSGPRFETVAEAVAAAVDPTGKARCIHCGNAVAVISVFCSDDCRTACLAACGAGSTAQPGSVRHAGMAAVRGLTPSRGH